MIVSEGWWYEAKDISECFPLILHHDLIFIKTFPHYAAQRNSSPSLLHTQISFQHQRHTMSTGEIACSYAAMILHDDGIAITAEKIAALLNAANLSVESFWPSLFAKLADKRNLGDLIMNVGSGGGGGAAVAVAAPTGGAAAAAAPVVEEKKEEAKEESDDDMGFSLFD
ncbi:hypothetical protein Q3G72_024147 [Acer saccharum]|nr:hypothetical protein Q3G72_024147 [Acer saccharum]